MYSKMLVERRHEHLKWVLRIILLGRPLGRHFLQALEHPSGMGGDPGWEISFAKKDSDLYAFVWSDGDVSGFDESIQDTCSWSELALIAADVLDEISYQYPDRRNEAEGLKRRILSGEIRPVGL